jgi:hypothetical protein
MPLDFVLLQSDEASLQALLHREDVSEEAAYMLFGKAVIAAAPLDRSELCASDAEVTLKVEIVSRLQDHDHKANICARNEHY